MRINYLVVQGTNSELAKRAFKKGGYRSVSDKHLNIRQLVTELAIASYNLNVCAPFHIIYSEGGYAPKLAEVSCISALGHAYTQIESELVDVQL